jgi:hypothetical protein
VLGDKASMSTRAELDARGAVVVILPRRTRNGRFDVNREVYRWRHLVENTFAHARPNDTVAEDHQFPRVIWWYLEILPTNHRRKSTPPSIRAIDLSDGTAIFNCSLRLWRA